MFQKKCFITATKTKYRYTFINNLWAIIFNFLLALIIFNFSKKLTNGK